MNVIEKIQREQIRTDLVPFKVGDAVKVHSRIKEGDRERIQVFAGIIINKQGAACRDLHRPPHQLRRRRRAHFPDAFPFHPEVEVERAGNVAPRQALLPA